MESWDLVTKVIGTSVGVEYMGLATLFTILATRSSGPLSKAQQADIELEF